MSGVQLVLARLNDLDRKPKKSGSGWKALCPAHDDKNPSLSVSEGDDGKALINCHARCSPENVVTALGLTMADLAAPGRSGAQAAWEFRPGRQGSKGPSTGQDGAPPVPKPPRTFISADSAGNFLGKKFSGPPTRVWSYHDLEGREVGRILRWDKPEGGKDVRPVSLIDGGWANAGMPKPRPLYRLPEFVAATGTTFVAEGEKCADVMVALGFSATTSAGGSKAAKETDWSPLAGRDVVILPDHDGAGRKYAHDVCALLAALVPPAQVRVLDLPDLPEAGDVADFVDRCRGTGMTDESIASEIQRLLETAVPAMQAVHDPLPASAHEEAEALEDDEVWKYPVALSAPPPPEFPLEVLPRKVQEFVTAVSTELQVPLGMVAICALACVASCIAKRKKVRVRERWTEELTLYVVAAMVSAERKSSVLATLTEPMIEWQQAKAKEMAPIIEDAKVRHEIATARVKKIAQDLVKAARQERDGLEADLDQARRELQAIKIPAAPRIRADDITPEELGRVMAQNGGKISVISSEGGFFDTIAGRYSDGVANIDLFLKGWDGREQWDRDRVGDAHRSIRAPLLTLILLVQPDVVQSIGQNEKFKGRGGLARLLYCLPESKVGFRDDNPPTVPPHLTEWWSRLIYAYLDCDDVRDEFDEIKGEEIAMQPAAEARIREFTRELEPRLGQLGDLSYMGGWAGKLVGTIARIAGILRLLEDPRASGTCVCESDVVGAVKVGRYLLAHAMTAYDCMEQDPDLARARHISAWILATGVLEFTGRDVLNAVKREFRRMDEVDKGLAILEERGHIRKVEQAEKKPGRGRPRSPSYQVNPQFYLPPKPPAESAKIPRPTVPDPAGVNFADFAGTSEGDRDADEEEVDLLAEVPCEEAEEIASPSEPQADGPDGGAPWRRSLEGLPYQPLYGGWRLIEIPRNWNAPEGADAAGPQGGGPQQRSPAPLPDGAPGDPDSPLRSDAGASSEGDEWQR